MANPNLHKARQALKLKRCRKAGSLSDVIQWRALKAAETAMYAAGKARDRSGTLKAVHAITQAQRPMRS